ncbi:calcineurin-like phosphoesterase C-terminal domain-containing protein [Muricauda brasiliensis]|uniref:calcineurin-like phosphoesterase C-terminal domain-containing protein n=1 Tax=Muricauda brasiliensis TaxID=2162892 RepID=UPI000D38CB8A|nr:calcineurin-like phosphoesterase family protein [Muricauda brasiliensis]
MKHTRRKFVKTGIGGLASITSFNIPFFGLIACSSDSTEVPSNNSLGIIGVSVPPVINASAGSEVVLTGKGFKVGDQIEWISTSDDSKRFSSSIGSATEASAALILPTDILSGGYRLVLSRDGETLMLGSVQLNIVADSDIPDIEGMTVKGIVFSNGVGVAGVVVSDGHEVAMTNEEGVYYLPSNKESGFVFISVPGNYEVPANGNAPQFFKRLTTSAATVEQHDFSLIETDNAEHVVLTMADWHLANRNNDLEQFQNMVLPDVNAMIDSYSAAGKKVYVLTLGDMTWDLYWYSNGFGLNDYIPYMNQLHSPVFNVIGNHDYDPYFANDRLAEDPYRNILGPTYYSFNLGQIHYVVLDDVEYLNTGGSQGTVGSRNYRERLAAEQLEWLKKDLAMITDKNTPVVIATHTPIYKNPSLDEMGNQVNSYKLDNAPELMACLQEFSTVHILTGHTHINYTVEEELGIIEHNTAAICATWWWTGREGYAGNHICKDGSPGGYGIWEINGDQMQWQYKSIGFDTDYQFRAYDLNTVHITAAKFAPNASEGEVEQYAGPYAQPNLNNEVLINIWGYDDQWQIEVSENGRSLDVSRVKMMDPLHIISYDALRLNVGAQPTGAFATSETGHLFKVQASAPNSTLEIKVTDRFGRVYAQSMERPKAFSTSIT